MVKVEWEFRSFKAGAYLLGQEGTCQFSPANCLSQAVSEAKTDPLRHGWRIPHRSQRNKEPSSQIQHSSQWAEMPHSMQNFLSIKKAHSSKFLFRLWHFFYSVVESCSVYIDRIRPSLKVPASVFFHEPARRHFSCLSQASLVNPNNPFCLRSSSTVRGMNSENCRKPIIIPAAVIRIDHFPQNYNSHEAWQPLSWANTSI